MTRKLALDACAAAAEEGALFEFFYFAVAIHEKSGIESLVLGTLAETAEAARAKYIGTANGYKLARVGKFACIEVREQQKETKVSG